MSETKKTAKDTNTTEEQKGEETMSETEEKKEGFVKKTKRRVGNWWKGTYTYFKKHPGQAAVFIAGGIAIGCDVYKFVVSPLVDQIRAGNAPTVETPETPKIDEPGVGTMDSVGTVE